MEENYVIAIYARISVDKGEHASIYNQENIIKQYIQNNDELKNSIIKEFHDIGYTGVNFNRPGIKNLLNEVRHGNIDCIIVKDFSRFGRNYIEVGNYIEQIFPFIGIRFISINDNYDSFKNNNDFIDLEFKNLIHDYYSREISKKVKQYFILRATRGAYAGSGFYGYIKNRKNKLEIERNESENVKRIFKLFLDGKTTSQIAEIFNKENIPSPYYSRFSKNKICYWNTSNILKILKDERYTGKMISNKKNLIEIGGKNYINTKEKDWIIVNNTHEPIISNNNFNAVKEKLNKTKKLKISNNYKKLIFSGKLRCGICGSVITKYNKKNCYICKNRKTSIYNKCYEVNIKEEDLTKVTKLILKFYSKEIYKNLNTDKSKDVLKLKNKDYEKFKFNQTYEYENEYFKQFDNNKIADEFTYKTSDSFIKRIYLYDKEKIEIKFNFKDIFI